MKQLPIGIQTLAKIKERDAIYIDKTGYAMQLVNSYNCVFLSRPRRFGKSLFIDTLKEMFQGNRQLFTGLAAEKEYDWSKTYPVINLCMADGEFDSEEHLRESLAFQLEENERRLGVATEKASVAIRFSKLIKNAREKYKSKVVVLIDEYDKPIINNISNPAMAHRAKTILHSFYETLKNNDANIHFTFITGVSRFAKVSIFSGLNNLEDISLSPQFGSICGYTHSELETEFSLYLQGVNIEEVKKWYNGYNFLGEKVYNPFDILLFFRNKTLSNYWFETSNPAFLVELIKEKRFPITALINITVGERLLNSFDPENIDLITILFQSGYLTIKHVERRGNLVSYHLGFPNLEVSSSFTDVLLPFFSELRDNSQLQLSILRSLNHHNMEQFEQAVHTLFAAIPYHNFTGNDIARYEGFYSSVIYAWLAASQLLITVEDCTNKGRIDMSIVTDNNRLYILEFKVDKDSSALKQIKERKYAEKYIGKYDAITLIGISFDSRERNISEFIWEKYKEKP